MEELKSRKIFVTATGTDIGKTYITALIVKKLREAGKNAAYYTAAVSGNKRDENGKLIPGDALWVKNISQIEQPIEEMCPYIYENAVSPHLASRMEGNPVRKEVVKDGFEKVCGKYDYITMEGSGGIVCPISYDGGEWYLWELVKELDLSCILVADAGLGTINDVVLTVSFMKSKGIEVKGIIFNHYHPGNMMEEDNKYMCEHLTGVKVIACVQEGDTDIDIDAEELELLYDE